jgi:hypothetical protein
VRKKCFHLISTEGNASGHLQQRKDSLAAWDCPAAGKAQFSKPGSSCGLRSLPRKSLLTWRPVSLSESSRMADQTQLSFHGLYAKDRALQPEGEKRQIKSR